MLNFNVWNVKLNYKETRVNFLNGLVIEFYRKLIRNFG